MHICVVSGRVHMCYKWSCIHVFKVVVYICVVSGGVYLCCKWSCIFVL
jgi:hypothetical protein